MLIRDVRIASVNGRNPPNPPWKGGLKITLSPP